MNIRKIIVTTLAIALVAACASAPKRSAPTVGDNYAFTADYLPELIRKKMQERKVVGLSIAIVDNQDVAWAEGFGFADKDKSIPATPETIYRAGSITKLFTATAAMQLAESGKLDIDQPLQNYLPEFSIRSRFVDTRPITLRDLMTHHSGLPSDLHNGSWGDDQADFTDLATMLRDEYVATPPNTIESYSNLGFSLLGHVIERVSGTSYADYVENRVLRPAGMQHAYISSNLNDDERRSQGYAKKKAQATPSLRDLPAGGLGSSVVDLARFAQMTFADGAHGGNQILRPETLAEMQSFQDTDGTFDVNPSVGLAWRLVDSWGDDAGVIAGHNGGTPMFHSEFLTLPKHKLAVVVLANTDTAAGVVHEIAREAMELALQSKTGIKRPERTELKESLIPVQTDLERLPGYWSTPMGLVRIQRKGDRLKFEVDGHKLNLVRREDGYYHLQYKLLGLVSINLGDMARIGLGYRKMAGREVLGLYLNGKPRAIVAEKVAASPLPANWSKFAGHYESVNTTGSIDMQDVELKVEDGLLLVSSTVAIDAIGMETSTDVLWPVSDNEAITHGLGRSKGETVRFFEQDGKVMAAYSGFLLRRAD
ncbi:MAG: beta-lactamase family protein [Gammaproteobacteria bacterium]|nr:beta-lactamase family protein [Gammaproteobacteria bacterium]